MCVDDLWLCINCVHLLVCVIVVTMHGTDNMKKDVFYYDARLQVLPKMVISPWLLLNMKATDLSKRPEPQRRVFSDVLVCISNAFHAVHVMSLLCRLVSCSTRYVQKSVSCHLWSVTKPVGSLWAAEALLDRGIVRTDGLEKSPWREPVTGNAMESATWPSQFDTGHSAQCR